MSNANKFLENAMVFDFQGGAAFASEWTGAVSKNVSYLPLMAAETSDMTSLKLDEISRELCNVGASGSPSASTTDMMY